MQYSSLTVVSNYYTLRILTFIYSFNLFGYFRNACNIYLSEVPTSGRNSGFSFVPCKASRSRHITSLNYMKRKIKKLQEFSSFQGPNWFGPRICRLRNERTQTRAYVCLCVSGSVHAPWQRRTN